MNEINRIPLIVYPNDFEKIIGEKLHVCQKYPQALWCRMIRVIGNDD